MYMIEDVKHMVMQCNYMQSTRSDMFNDIYDTIEGARCISEGNPSLAFSWLMAKEIAADLDAGSYNLYSCHILYVQ